MKGICLAPSELGDAHRDPMFALLQLCFLNVSRDVFHLDLQGKDRVVLLFQDDALAGFSTFTLRPELDWQGRSASVLCSGDTIIDPKHWGSSALGRTLIQSAWDMHRKSQRQSFWWLLITSGPRTWGVLPTFFKSFIPHPQGTADENVKLWMHNLCEQRWPNGLDQSTGLIRLPHPQKLRPPLDTLPATRSNHSDLRWYEAQNPQWRQGDELPSLVQIDPANLTRAGWRYLSGYLNSQP